MKQNLRQAVARLWKDIQEYKFLGIFLLTYYLIVEFIFSAFCPSVIITGFPCPGCGITRGLFFVITGQFGRAWNINPFIYGWIFLALYIGVNRYLLGRKARGAKYVLVILAVAMMVVFLYRMYRYFPNKPPMTFTEGSLLERLVPGYGRTIRNFINTKGGN